MRKIMAILFVFTVLLAGCGASINGEEVAQINNPLNNSQYCEQCNLRLTFTSGIDQETGDEYWKYLLIENREDRGALIWIALENGGYVLEDTFINRNTTDFRRQIYIKMNGKIIIHIERPNPGTNDWQQCGDDMAYKLD